MGASWTRSSRRSGCSAFAEQELARAVRRFGGSYELSAPTRFLEGGGPAVQAVVPARGSRLERELGLRRAAFTCASVSVSQASTSSESKGPRRLLAAARRQRPPRKRGVWTTRATAPARERRRLSQAPRPRLHRLDELGRRDVGEIALVVASDECPSCAWIRFMALPSILEQRPTEQSEHGTLSRCLTSLR